MSTQRVLSAWFTIPSGTICQYTILFALLCLIAALMLSTFTRPNVPQFPDYPEGFQGNDIPLDGAVVARLVQKRLTLEPDTSDDF